MARTKQPAKRSWGKRQSAGASTSTSTSTPRRSPRKGPGSSGTGQRQKQKPHRFKPGTQALREICRLQKTVNLLIPAAPFIRTVKDISNYIAPEVTRWQAEALQALQEAAEDYIVQLFEDSMLCAIHAKRVTLSKFFHGALIVCGRDTCPHIFFSEKGLGIGTKAYEERATMVVKFRGQMLYAVTRNL